ncbi:hypothetical protein MCETHM1_02875 [Flavobacteriaceae bacterium]
MIKKISPHRLFFCFFLSLFIALLLSSKSYSQTVRYDSVSKQKYVLVNVQKTYERIIEKGYESAELFESLGNYYYENKNFTKSKLYFDKLFAKYSLSQISKKSIERYHTISN